MTIFVVFQHFPRDSSVFFILQFLCNFLHSFLDEDGHSSPIRHTNVFSHVERALIGLQKIVVFEIQALVATQSTHILNFFASNS